MNWSKVRDRLSDRFSEREKSDIIRALKEDVSGLDESTVESLISRLNDGEPLAYVTGVQYFYGLRLNIDDSVLIPRPETEELADWVINDISTSDCQILDIGTGSGALAIAVAYKTKSHLLAVDISPSALSVAARNSQKLGVRIEIREVDFLNHKSRNRLGVYDVIMSNPPYVSEGDALNLGDDVLIHEPHEALFAPGDDPLIFYKRIAEFGRDHLNEGGAIYVELNEYLASEIDTIFSGEYEVIVRKDLQGKQRMLKATKL